MNIPPKAIHYAIHGLLARHQVEQGFSFPLKQLMAEWPGTALRRGDLIKGLEGLRKSGHLSIDQTPEGPMVRLINEDFGLIVTAQDRDAVTMLTRLRELRRRPQSHVAALVPDQKHARRPGESGPKPSD